MRYWLTTHWPRYRDAGDEPQSGIHLPDGRHRPGDNVAPGDRVLIYESKTGRSTLITDTRGNERSRMRRTGAEGIVVVAEVTTRVEANPNAQPETYSDGSTIHWKWKAETRSILTTGFVSSADVKRIVGFDDAYTMRAIGKQQSGLLELTDEQYEALVAIFKGNAIGSPELNDVLEERKKRPPRNYFGPESDAHRQLKEYVAANPSSVLNETGLTTVGVEYQFATNDRADVVLKDADGKLIGVEIEVEQGPEQLDGLLQAIKYRFMLAPFNGIPFEQTRGVLVAYRLSEVIRDACEQYEVEHFEVDRGVVEAWASANGH